jgi:photosystem II stability/assembly factor-like uncharacterized protein
VLHDDQKLNLNKYERRRVMEHTTFFAVVSKHFHQWHETAAKTMRDLVAPIGILLALPLTMAAAQPVPPSAFSALQWRLVGPFRAGRAIAAAGIPGNPYTFFFGSVAGGVWKSTNAGQTWEPISDGQMNPSIGAFAIASSNPKIIYVGTGEADIRSDITYGDGVYKSADGGAHWTHVGLTDSRHIGKLLIDPRNPNLVLAAALGHAYGPNAERGVYRTTDGGQNWTNALHRGPDVGAVDLAWDEGNPAVVYATMWEARRTPWSQYPPNQGPGSGLYKSTDEGKTWSELTGNGLPLKPYGRIRLAVVPGSRGNTVYALMEAAKEGTGLYRSQDGGQHWELRSKDPNITARMWYFTGMCVDPQQADVIYIPNRSLMRSTDGGKTFTAIKGSPGGDDYHFLWIDPTNNQRMIVASDQGTTVSLDGGQTWSSWYNQPTGQFYHVATDNQFPYRIYGAQQDAGTACITSRSDFGVITFRDWSPVGAGESGYIAPDPVDPNTIYGGDTYGSVFRFDRTTGQSQVISPSLLASFGTPAPQRKYRFTWTSPLVFDRRDPQALYLGAQVLLQTRDGGLHWRPLSPDLSGAQPSQRSLSGPPTLANASSRGWGTIYTIAPSPLRDGLIWVGTDDGLIHVTKDGGQHWEEVTPAGLPRWSKISIIEASPFEAGVAYAAVDRHRLDDFAAYIYRTKDYGQHWSRADSGIGMGSFVRVVRSDLTRPGLLYAGTETGVFVSFDDGEHWQPLQLNLPQVSVRDLAVHDDDLVAATHGRAFWVLDDLTHLQQLNQQVLAAEAYLFRPERTVRLRRSVNHDTPLPPEESHGTNPPSGAIIDYYLGAAPQSPVTLEILDGSGDLLRKFSSTDQPEIPSKVPYFMKEWLPEFKQLTAHAGHNRFVWDLRYTSPPTKHDYYSMAAIAGAGTEREPQGPLVLPGKYQVKLSVGNHPYTQEITVVMDPRSRVTEDALKEQLALAMEVWNAIADQHGLNAAVDSLHDQLATLNQRSNFNSAARSILQSLETKTASLSDSLADPGLSQLETDIMNADRQPTQQMREAFAVLNTKVSNARTEWERLVSRDLPGLNKNLAKLGLAQLHASAISAPHLRHEAISGNR